MQPCLSDCVWVARSDIESVPVHPLSRSARAFRMDTCSFCSMGCYCLRELLSAMPFVSAEMCAAGTKDKCDEYKKKCIHHVKKCSDGNKCVSVTHQL